MKNIGKKGGGLKGWGMSTLQKGLRLREKKKVLSEGEREEALGKRGIKKERVRGKVGRHWPKPKKIRTKGRDCPNT